MRSVFAMRSVLVVLWICLTPLTAAAEGRVALLIGNGGYARDELALRNPANDVAALDAALARLGFDVRRETDLTREEMQEALTWFRGAAEGAEIAMIFYAGHAVQVGAENYLIGTELTEVSGPALTEASLTLSELIGATEGLGAGLSLIVLDACRDNPFGPAGLGRPGLAPVSGGAGTLVAYATDPGNVAADGAGENSPFTAALLQHIETPGLDVRLMFGRVRQDVVRRSGGAQVPWVEEAVLGEHAFAPAADRRDPDDEFARWRRAVGAHSVESYRGYLDDYPEGIYAIVARLRIDSLEGNAEEAEIAAADLPQATAALELAGYLVPSVGYPPDTQVKQAFAAWQNAQPAGARGFAALMGEGARKAAFVGTYTAGILRNDLQRFASVEESLRTAEENLSEAEAEFADDTGAQQTLATMRRQVAQIAAIKEGVAADLDASRTYYHDLLVLTNRYLSEYMEIEFQPRFASSRGITRLSDRAMSDAQTFYAHLGLVGDAPDGSYAWLTAFLEGNE
ncbi:MAG: caspase family protein [Pseudomonadota bacterium]